MQFPVVIGLRRSRLLPAAILATATVAATATLAWSPGLPFVAVSLLGAVVLATLAIHTVLTGPHALMFLADGSLQVVAAPGEDFRAASRLPGGIAHPWLTVLPYREATGRRRHAIVAVDSMGSDDFRRLRVLLRWHPAVNVAGGAP